jgi:hypothetical protein
VSLADELAFHGPIVAVHRPVETVAFSLAVQGQGFRIFPTTNGPATVTSFSGDFVAAVSFQVTAVGHFLYGYYMWVCPTGQSVAQQTFCLYEVTGPGTGTLQSNTTAISAVLTPGTWNYAPLVQPFALAANTPYRAATAFPNSFPDTTFQFGVGDPLSAGITNGPLFCFSSSGTPHNDGFNNGQGAFTTGTLDPTSVFPTTNSDDSNFWVDVQVDAP